jgi:hypothetical protein
MGDPRERERGRELAFFYLYDGYDGFYAYIIKRTRLVLR